MRFNGQASAEIEGRRPTSSTRAMTTRHFLRWALPAAPAFAAALAWALPARAQLLPGSEGFSLNPISPAPAGDRFFLVPDGATDPQTPDKPPLRAQILSHISLNPSLSQTVGGATSDVVATQLYGHLGLTVLAARWLHLSADLPLALWQDGAGFLGSGTALGDLRLGARLGLMGDRTKPWGLALGADVWLPTGEPALGSGDTEVRVEPLLSLGGQAGIFVYAAKGGFRFRRDLAPAATEVGHSMTVGAAAGLSLFDDVLQIGPEVDASILVVSESTPSRAFSEQTSLVSSVLGVRVQLGDFNLGAGAGLGLSSAPGVASRAFLALAYSPRAARPKYPRRGEKSPEQRESEVSQEFLPEPEEAPAAPAAAPAAPADQDGDGILDPSDACPEVPGVVSSDDPLLHGCPRPPAARGPSAEPKVAPLGPAATMVGFRETGQNSAQVYVQLTETAVVRAEGKGKRLSYRLVGITVPRQNNRNPLVTTHFGSVVETVRLVPDRKDTLLVIELRREVKASAKVVGSATGAVLEVDVVAEPAAPTGENGATSGGP